MIKAVPYGELNKSTNDWRKTSAYVYVQTGEHDLLKITGCRWDGTGFWAITGDCSWCMCDSDIVYLIDTEAERIALLSTLRTKHRVFLEKIQKECA